MVQLVIAVLAIALCALAVAGGINYLDMTVGERAAAREQAAVGFAVLDAGWSAYRISTGSAPSVAGWQDEIYPHYAQKPQAPGGMSWSYGSDASGWWFCLSGSAVGKPVYEGLARYVIDRAEDNFISAACGDPDAAADVGSFPAAIALTHLGARK